MKYDLDIDKRRLPVTIDLHEHLYGILKNEVSKAATYIHKTVEVGLAIEHILQE